jgi:hypothetical protein
MDELSARRRTPFAVCLVVVAVVSLAIFRLPELYVSSLRRNALLQDSQGMWAFRLLLLVAVGQALFGAYRVLRVERLSGSDPHPRLRPAGRLRLASTIGWTAAAMIAMTLVYGLAAFFTTGLRAGLWAFLAVIVAQTLWYYRLTGDMLRWLDRQPVAPPEKKPVWQRGDSDYVPPIARGLDRPPPSPSAVGGT